QIGTKDDEEKPKFAGLRPGQKMDDLTLEAALDLFKLPRELGLTPGGETVTANIGRFGPYVRYGNTFVSIRGEDPYTITFERALELIEAKKIADANRIIRDFPEAGIQVLNGRYGPYVTNRVKNAKIPKGTDPATLTLEECEALLAAAPERAGRRGKKKTQAADAEPAAAAADAQAPRQAAARRKKAATKTTGSGKKAGTSKKTAAKKAVRAKKAAGADSGNPGADGSPG